MAMEYETYELPSQLITLLFALVVLTRPQSASSLVNITECSVSHVSFTLIQDPDLQNEYTFFAACSTENGTCLFGEQRLGVRTIPMKGNNYTVNVEPSCTQSDKLSPGEMERCTLLISSFHLRAFTSGTTTTVCTLPTPSSPVVSTSSLPVDSTSIPTGTSANLSTPELIASIVVPSFLLITVLTVIIASLLMWMRHSQNRSRGIVTFTMDEVKITVSPSFLIGSGDDLTKDCCTVCDSMIFDDEEADKEIVHIEPDGSSLGIYDSPTDSPSTPMEAPSQNSYGYVGIRFNPQQ